LAEKTLKLLIPESVLAAAVRALPGDAVAGHAPYVFVHAALAYHEAAATIPAKGHLAAAAVADILAFVASSVAPSRLGW